MNSRILSGFSVRYPQAAGLPDDLEVVRGVMSRIVPCLLRMNLVLRLYERGELTEREEVA